MKYLRFTASFLSHRQMPRNAFGFASLKELVLLQVGNQIPGRVEGEYYLAPLSVRSVRVRFPFTRLPTFLALAFAHVVVLVAAFMDG